MELQTWKIIVTFVTVSAGVVAVIGPFLISNISDKIADQYKLELTRNFSELKKDNSVIQAKLDPFIEFAKQKFPSKSQDEALAALKEDLSSLQRQTNQLSKRLEQRKFNDNQTDAFLTVLGKLQKVKVRIENYNSDAEAVRFAKQISGLFKRAGWQVQEIVRLAGSPPKGIVIGVKERSAVLEEYVQGIGGVLQPFGNVHAELWDQISSGELLILVGTKE